jgi:hypothetical protein
MATNSRLFAVFLAVFLFPGLFSVYAQNSRYFIDAESGEPRFIQRLVWSGGEYALRYEAVIELEWEGTYHNYHREFTTELYIDISLQPGSYRFRVIPYDVLDRPGNASEWKYIEVLPALQPQIFAVLPENITGGEMEELLGFLLYITGIDFAPEAEVFIRFPDGTQIAVETLDLSDGDGFNIVVFVESDMLISGEYEIVVRNPSGLEASIGDVPIAGYDPEIEKYISKEESAAQRTGFDPLKPVMTSVNFALIPSFPVYGSYAKTGIAFFGLAVRANTLFYLPIGIYIGPEVTAMVSAISYHNYYGEDVSYGPDSEFFPDVLTLTAGVNLLARKWFPGGRFALSFRAGADFGILSDQADQLSIRMDISFLWRFKNRLLLEAGLDYSHLIYIFSGGYFSPWLGISYQF